MKKFWKFLVQQCWVYLTLLSCVLRNDKMTNSMVYAFYHNLRKRWLILLASKVSCKENGRARRNQCCLLRKPIAVFTQEFRLFFSSFFFFWIPLLFGLQRGSKHNWNALPDNERPQIYRNAVIRSWDKNLLPCLGLLIFVKWRSWTKWSLRGLFSSQCGSVSQP